MAPPYRILFITSRLSIRGRHSHLLTLCQELQKRGYHLEVIAPPGAMLSLFEQVPISYHPLNLTGNYAKDVFYLPKIVEIIRQSKAHFLHFVTPEFFWIAFLLSRFMKFPYFLTVHRFLDSPRSIKLNEHCRGIITVSQSLREFLVNQLNIPNTSIRVISNGVNLQRFQPKKNKESPSPSRPLVITSIGPFAVLNGQDTFLRSASEVLKENPSTLFLLVGEGKKEDFLRKIRRELALEKQVIFCNPCVAYERIFQMSDIYVSPRLSESLRQTTLEAMACGVPVVATKVGGVLAVIQDQETGLLIPKNDALLMKEAILKLIQNNNLAQTLSHNAHQWIQQNCNATQMADRFEEYYQSQL
jgi:glycosyltransferase involved in cell wall biosynthesis